MFSRADRSMQAVDGVDKTVVLLGRMLKVVRAVVSGTASCVGKGGWGPSEDDTCGYIPELACQT